MSSRWSKLILRCRTSLKNDFFRAIQTLHGLQDGKTDGNAPPGPKSSPNNTVNGHF